MNDDTINRLERKAHSRRRTLKTVLTMGCCTEEQAQHTQKMIDFLQTCKYSETHRFFFQHTTDKARLLALKSLGRRSRLREQHEVNEYEMSPTALPLFQYTVVCGGSLAFIGSENLGGCNTKMTKHAREFERNTDILLYDIVSARMVAYKDASGAVQQFSTLCVLKQKEMLGVKRNTRNRHKYIEANLCKPGAPPLHGVALYLNEEGCLLSLHWSKCGDCDVEDVEIINIPNNVYRDRLDEWININLSLMPVQKTKNLYLFVYRQKVVRTELSEAVQQRDVHFYNCRYSPVISTYAQLRGLRISLLGLCHSLQNVQNAVNCGLGGLPDAEPEDKEALINIQRLFSSSGSVFSEMLNAHVKELAPPKRYAPYRKYMYTRGLGRQLNRNREQYEAAVDSINGKRRAPAPLTKKYKFKNSTVRTIIRSECPRKRARVGRPSRLEQQQQLNDYQELQKKKSRENPQQQPRNFTFINVNMG